MNAPATSTPPALATQISAAYAQALDHLHRRQDARGALGGEVIWNPMLMCQYVIVCHVSGHVIPEPRRRRLRLYLERTEASEGGWGMFPGSPAWMFHTVLGIVALRLLGSEGKDPLVDRALAWLSAQPCGVHAIPTWGRIWLALLGLYPWSGVQPILPELWLLPDAAPMHPRRLYCHMRLIYLGLGFLYGTRHVAPASPVLDALRRELYPGGYDLRDFAAFANEVAATDLFERPPAALRLAFAGMRALERGSPGALRRRALSRSLEHIRFELRSTNYVCLSPVTGFLFALALHIHDPNDPDFAPALAGMDYWAWEDDEMGTRFCGARSDIWDTSFLLQAMSEGPPLPQARAIARAATRWLPKAQVLREIADGAAHYREPAYGGFGFADERHPWPVSDCTAEALEAMLRCEAAKLGDPEAYLDLARISAAVEFILRRQNDDGGFGSYEPRRGPMLLRRFNPAEMYGNCMLEYSYTECTGSCVRTLAYVLEHVGWRLGEALRARMRQAIAAGTTFLRGSHDGTTGAWLGFWGINVTYGTFFAAGGLMAGGVPPSSTLLAGAVRWLVDHQRPDGGWGESWEGMTEEKAVPLPADAPSLVTQTAWALLTLLEAAPSERAAIDRGVRFLLARQGGDGAWPPEAASGCFFNTAVLDYELYRQVFPAWALARYQRVFGISARREEAAES